MSSSVQSAAAAASAPADGVWRPGAEAPYYVPVGREVDVFTACHGRGLPVMLKGPTGCGKTRFVEHMAWRLGRPLVTVACHDDLAAGDLTGRWLVRGGETVWVDGPLATAARLGRSATSTRWSRRGRTPSSCCIRSPTTAACCPSRRRRAAPRGRGFQLVVSYNPGYQHAIKDLKPSTRQRFVALEFDHPPAEVEARIVAHESGVSSRVAGALVDLARRVRRLRDEGLPEGPGTRTVVAAGRLIAGGIAPADACRAAMAVPLTEDADLLAAIGDLVEGMS
jgi:nitric oxide reductase NorQ protein